MKIIEIRYQIERRSATEISDKQASLRNYATIPTIILKDFSIHET